MNARMEVVGSDFVILFHQEKKIEFSVLWITASVVVTEDRHEL